MEVVSFEIAKKLKEKGFREKCLTYYDVDDNVGLLYNTQYTDETFPCQYTDLLISHNAGEGRQLDNSDNCVDAPTISQVLKWLREEKKLFVKICYYEYGYYYEVIDIATAYVKVVSIEYNSYEHAALAGIEYVLDNLI